MRTRRRSGRGIRLNPKVSNSFHRRDMFRVRRNASCRTRVLSASSNRGEELCPRTPTAKPPSITRTPRKAIAWLRSIMERETTRRDASMRLKLVLIPRRRTNTRRLRTARVHRISKRDGTGPLTAAPHPLIAKIGACARDSKRAMLETARWEPKGSWPAYCRLIARNQRRTIATEMSDAAIIRMTSNCNSNDPAISNSGARLVCSSDNFDRTI